MIILDGGEVELGPSYGDQVFLLHAYYQGKGIDSTFLGVLVRLNCADICKPEAQVDAPRSSVGHTHGSQHISANGVKRARCVHVLGESSEKCKGSNASIVFSYNGKYLANTGSLGSLRLEHVEEFQELSFKNNDIHNVTNTSKTKVAMQCNFYKVNEATLLL